MGGRDRRQGALGRLIGLAVILLAGCGPASPTAPPSAASTPASAPPSSAAPSSATPSASPSATEEAGLVLAAFGDSITAVPGSTCPGCTPFVDRYAEALTEATGESVAIRNLARPSLRVEVLLQELMAGSSMQDAAASADAVIVGVGNSDAPWNITDDACDGPATAVELVPWDRYSAECIATEVERFRPAFDALFERIVELRAGQPTILRTINRYNDWIGFDGVVPPEAVEISVAYNVAWNAMICATAEADGFACGDVGAAFNGADGRTASGDLLAADYLHPSDKGYERIAEVLVELGFAPLVP